MEEQDKPVDAPAEPTSVDEAPKGYDLNEGADRILALTKSEPNSEPANAPKTEPEAPAKQADKAPEPTLSEEERKAGELRQADYTRKTQELAEQRKAVEAERQRIGQERAQYAQQLQGVMFALQQEKPPNWDELLATDPTAYLQERHKWEQKAQAFQQAQQQLAYVNHVQQQEQQQHLAAFVSQQGQQMLDAVPEWKDEAKREAEHKNIRSALQKAGFRDEELNQIYDHRMLVVARKAMLYDDMVANMAKAKEAAQKAPPVRPLSSGVPSDGQHINQAAFQRLKRSGGRSMDDATAAIRSLLG